MLAHLALQSYNYLMNKFKKSLSIFLALSPLFLLVFFKWLYPDLLVFDNLFSSLQKLYQNYGPLILFVAGLTESIFLVNLYFPGAFVILLGGVLASTGVITLPAVIFWGTLGLVMGYSFNYAVGRFGWYEIFSKLKIFKFVDLAKRKLGENKFIFLWGTIHPNSASLLSLAAGIIQLDFWTFLFLVTIFQLLWSTFWALFMYFLGVIALKSISNITLAVLLAIIAFWLFKKIIRNRN